MPTFYRISRHKPQEHKAADVLRQPPSFFTESFSPDAYELRTTMNREHTVCFTGHRAVSSKDTDSRQRLETLIGELYLRGYRDFLCGGAVGFDTIAAEYVTRFREDHPDVRLIYCLPCADQSARWKKADAARYERLLYLGDEIRVLSPSYYEGCMQARNAYMVDRSYVCVAYMSRLRGGTLSTVRYALSQDVPVVNIAVPTAVEEFTQAFPL